MTYLPNHLDLDLAWERLMRHPVLGLVDGWVTYGWGGCPKRWLAYHHAENREIVISPRLDKWFVPQYVLRDILGHEILHALIPWTCKADQHSDQFRAAEARLPGHARAVKWWTRNSWRLVD